MVIVAAAGQTILTTAGMASGTTILSAPLIWPDAKGVVGCLGQGGLLFRLGPELVLSTPLGADLCG